MSKWCHHWYHPRYACKVTVINIMGQGICPAGIKIGDSWIWKWGIPNGMCPFMAHDLFPIFQALTFGGNIAWESKEGETTICCGDHRFPVVVKIERISAMSPSEITEFK